MLADIILAASLLAQPSPTPANQQPWNYQYDDARARERTGPESPQERARREYQQRHPEMRHCRLPACSTR